MTRHFSQLIALGCLALIVVTPIVAVYLLINIDQFARIAQRSFGHSIQWNTVSDSQWYSLWALTFLYVAIGLIGLHFLRRAFSNFANGALFNYSNSRDVRLFAVCLFIQALAKPMHFSLASILLSMNHPAGQKVLSVSLGSDEIKVIALGMILWVMSSLLVSATRLENENKQFI
jgi:hypothetical protein